MSRTFRHYALVDGRASGEIPVRRRRDVGGAYAALYGQQALPGMGPIEAAAAVVERLQKSGQLPTGRVPGGLCRGR
jgi:hypothetical protein